MGDFFGARALFFLQYPEFAIFAILDAKSSLLSDRLWDGLDVYGGLLGSVAALAILRRRNMLAFADMAAPIFMLALAIGRWGCFFNGCCFGAPTDAPYAVSFLEGSPAYLQQKSFGMLHGVRVDEKESQGVILTGIEQQSPAAKTGLRKGDAITAINRTPVQELVDAHKVLVESGSALSMRTADAREEQWSVGSLPSRSYPVHATQLYSSVSAAILFVLGSAWQKRKRRHGESCALILTLYPISCLVIEPFRGDASVDGGRPFLFVLIAIAVVIWLYLWKSKRTEFARNSEED